MREGGNFRGGSLKSKLFRYVVKFMMGYLQVVPLSRGKGSGIDEESAMAKVRSKPRELLFCFVISRREAALFRF